MKKEEKLERIINIFRSGEKNKKDFKVGMEIEHFIVDKDTLEPFSYYGEKGVKETLLDLSKDLNKEKLNIEGEDIFGYSKDEYDVSIEPGAQFEISINRKDDVCCLEKIYSKAINDVTRVLDKKNQRLLAIGYRPFKKLDEVDMIPRDRYHKMWKYFSDNGMGHNMMLQTAAVQVAIDYSDEADFKKKYFIINAISPILYAIFDSIYLFEGEKIDKKHNKRAEIWYNTSPERTGIFKGVTDDFGYEDYAKTILDLSPIYDIRTDKYCPKTSLSELLDQDLTEEEINNYIIHSLSIVFPDVRLKNYIEIRSMDSLPADLSFSAAALLKGILYSEDIDEIYSWFKNINDKTIIGGVNGIINNGLEAYYASDYVVNWALKLIDFAENSISNCEKKYLIGLREMIENMDTPKDIFKSKYIDSGIREAYKYFEVNNEIR